MQTFHRIPPVQRGVGASIAISDDDGSIWPWVRGIDSVRRICGEANWHLTGQSALPSIVEGEPSELDIAYYWGNLTAIHYVCFTLGDIVGH